MSMTCLQFYILSQKTLPFVLQFVLPCNVLLARNKVILHNSNCMANFCSAYTLSFKLSMRTWKPACAVAINDSGLSQLLLLFCASIFLSDPSER